MTVVDIIGATAAFNVSLNTVSLVSLIIYVGYLAGRRGPDSDFQSHCRSSKIESHVPGYHSQHDHELSGSLLSFEIRLVRS